MDMFGIENSVFFNEIQSKKIKGFFNLYTLTMNLNTIIQCEYI
jgi:hypothetical protein